MFAVGNAEHECVTVINSIHQRQWFGVRHSERNFNPEHYAVAEWVTHADTEPDIHRLWERLVGCDSVGNDNDDAI